MGSLLDGMAGRNPAARWPPRCPGRPSCPRSSRAGPRSRGTGRRARFRARTGGAPKRTPPGGRAAQPMRPHRS
eukprot:2961979-Pyramimonas_sp.AAC.1